jgi:hypothetical protein
MTLKISSAFDVTEILILQSTQELSERPVDNFRISAQNPSKFSSPITNTARTGHHWPSTNNAIHRPEATNEARPSNPQPQTPSSKFNSSPNSQCDGKWEMMSNVKLLNDLDPVRDLGWLDGTVPVARECYKEGSSVLSTHCFNVAPHTCPSITNSRDAKICRRRAPINPCAKSMSASPLLNRGTTLVAETPQIFNYCKPPHLRVLRGKRCQMTYPMTANHRQMTKHMEAKQHHHMC